MKSTLKGLALILATGLAAVSIPAAATDIRLVNLSNVQVHPYFRSSCFAAPTPRNQWVFFGGVGAYSQFTWTQFEMLMDPTCKKPTVEFTYNVDGMMPPLDNVPSDLVARVKVSASDTGITGVYVIQSQVRGSSSGDHNDD